LSQHFAIGITKVSLEDRTRLLTDKGSGYVSRAFRLVGMRHILASPFYPQTNGKLESYYQTLRREVSQIPYRVPQGLCGLTWWFSRYS
jgi:transposase InsO family protein